jgi:hypothetical protein
MTPQGLLLSEEGAEHVQVRVAAEFCSGLKQQGAWSNGSFKLSVAPQHALLLHHQPPAAKKTWRTHTYEALYGWTPADITATLGGQGGWQGLLC